MTYEERVCEEAVLKFGASSQQIKACEEMAELSALLLKQVNGGDVKEENILGELGDVLVMLEQLKQIFPTWKYAFNQKIRALEDKIICAFSTVPPASN